MQTDTNRNKAVNKFLQGKAVTQIMSSGLTVHPLVADVSPPKIKLETKCGARFQS